MPRSILTICAMTLIAVPAVAQAPDLYVPRNIERAYDSGTRSWDGMPGMSYWQNRADYDIRVLFDPATALLRGDETITYVNNSPDTLSVLVLDVTANYYRVGTARDWPHAPSDLGEGVTIDAFALNGRSLDPSRSGGDVRYQMNGMKLIVPAMLPPGQNAEFSISWHYTVNRGSHLRTGAVDSTTFFIAYFFPRVAVYDDIEGWDRNAHAGNLEFYNDFGDFSLEVSVPPGTLVWATGLLQNPADVLTDTYAQRYRAAFTADTIVHVVSAAEAIDGAVTADNATNVWKFAAEYVSDVAFAVSDHYLWDATSLVVDSSSGRRVLVEAAYADTSTDFHEVAQIARASIEIMSFQFPAVPFPFPNMTVFNGLDEMEYPMMVNDHSITGDRRFVVELTSHEIFHSYFPFYMGINETKYAWMDEGWATAGDYVITNMLHQDEPSNIFLMDLYQTIVGSEVDIPIYAASDYSKRPAYFFASYPKAAFFYHMLKDVLGDDLFMEALHEYMRRWNGKHPTPYDFFFTFNDVTGQDLSWLYTPWFFEFGCADLAIGAVSRDGDTYAIEIKRVGSQPVPVHLTVTYTDGSSEEVHGTAAIWRDGGTTHTVELTTANEIREIQLGDPNIPDADKSNNGKRP